MFFLLWAKPMPELEEWKESSKVYSWLFSYYSFDEFYYFIYTPDNSGHNTFALITVFKMHQKRELLKFPMYQKRQ